MSLVLVVLLALAAEVRSFPARVELTGPIERVRFDCGTEGDAVLQAGLTAGERRTVLVPLPVRAPLGAGALGALPPPRVVVTGTGTARVLGWSHAQPSASLERVGPALLARTRPALGATDGVPVGLAGGALLLVVTAGLGALGLRRRAFAALGVGLLGGAAALGLVTRGASGAAGIVAVLEQEAGRAEALLVTVGARLPLGAETVFLAEPEGVPLHFELRLEGGTVRGEASRPPGARVTILEPRRTVDTWTADGRAPRTLRDVWTRDPNGTWVRRGPWERGETLPPPLQEGAPPGWLATGLPPGRGVLVGRESGAGPDEAWLRVVGF